MKLYMFVKVKPGRLNDLPLRHRRFLSERRRYYADDVGGGVVIPLEDADATMEFFIDNSHLERFTEAKPHRSVKEYMYAFTHRKRL